MTTATKFEAGQRVRFNQDYGLSVTEGTEATVVSAFVSYGQPQVQVRLDNGPIYHPLAHRLDAVEEPLAVWERELLGLNDAPERKFKVGDKVEFTKDDGKGYAGYETGDVLTIVESDEWEQSRIADPTTDWDYVARRDSDGFGQFVNEGHLTAHVPSKWPLKKGDTVYTTNAETYDTVGHELTIYSVDEEDDVLPYEVKDESGQFEWVSPEDLTAEKPVVLTPAVGDKVRFTNGGSSHRWIGDSKPEGTVVERRENHMRVQWTGDKHDSPTMSGFGRATSEESIARMWEKIEEFTPQRKFAVGDTVKVVNNTTYGHDNGTVGKVTRVENVEWDGKDRFYVASESGEVWYHHEDNLEPYTGPVPSYKFEVGQTVKVVNANRDHHFAKGAIGTVVAIDTDGKAYPKGVRPYEVDAGHTHNQWLTEDEIEAYTPHALDDAKVGTAFTMHREGKPYVLVVKKAEGAWQQFKLGDNEVYVLQTLNESGAREHFDWAYYKPVLVK